MPPTMSGENGVLRTFRSDEPLMQELQDFLTRYPEVGSLNLLVNLALKEFLALHKKDRTWLKTYQHRARPSEKSTE